MPSRPYRLLLPALLTGALAAQTTSAPPPAPGTERFFPVTRSFHLDVPTGWRQLSPGALRDLKQRHQDLPVVEFASTEPGLCYVVGPVQAWLDGAFDPSFLYVVEQDQEWFTDADFAERIAASWRDRSQPDGPDHTVRDVKKEKVGPDGHEVITAVRDTRQPGNRPPLRSLDVYAPTGGRQVSIAFTCPTTAWEHQEPAFRKLLSTLTFARKSRGEQKLSDRLWTPLLVGAGVGLVFLILYKRNRRAV